MTTREIRLHVVVCFIRGGTPLSRWFWGSLLNLSAVVRIWRLVGAQMEETQQ